MSSQSHQPVTTTEEATTPQAQSTGTGTGTSNSARSEDVLAGPDTPPTTETRGGGTHLVAKGETLQKIAKSAVGHRRYWESIRDGNNLVFDGERMMVGDTLTIPELETPTNLDSGGPVPAGGTTRSEFPEKHITDYGVIQVWPEVYPGTLPAPTDGELNMKEVAYGLFLLQQTAAAMAEAVAAVGEVRDLMSYAVFLDWVITDAEATQALERLGGLGYSMIPLAITGIGDLHYTRLMENLPDAQKQTVAWSKVQTATCLNEMDDATLKLHFDRLPDEELLALHALMAKRFDLEVGGREGNVWTAPGLRQAWGVLETLPPGHVEDNEMLDMLLRSRSGGGSGYYRGSDDSTVIGYETGNLDQTGGYGSIMVEDPANPGTEMDVSLNVGVNLFNTVVRHEIGHAVDAEISASTGYAATAENAGKWLTYANKTAFIDAIVATGMSGNSYPDDAAYELVIRQAVNHTQDFNTALQVLKDANTVADEVTEADATTTGPVAAVFETARWSSATSPWYNQPNRPGTGGRQWVQSYGSKYSSYLEGTVQAFGVSEYQFRAPGEWFAEAYACYYSDHDSETGSVPGTRLRTRDSATAIWFDTHVDGGHSLPAETNQAEEPPAPTTAPAAP